MEIGFASHRLVHEMFGVFVTTKKKFDLFLAYNYEYVARF